MPKGECEIAYKLGGPSSKKTIKDEKCIINDHQCTQNKVAVNDYINSQMNSL